MNLVVAVAEPNPVYAAALVSLIGDEPGLEPAGPVDGVEPLLALITSAGAQAAVVAEHLPGGGVEAVAERLRRLRRPCRLIVVASVGTPSIRIAAGRAGATLVDLGDGRRLLEALTAAAH